MTKDLWKKYKGDFNAMTNEEVDFEVENSLEVVAIEEEWLEAVASWVEAGKPRE